MKIEPLGDKVLIEPLEADKQTKGGILLPDSARDTPQRGKVIAVGPGAKNEAGKLIPMVLKVGDQVFYRRYGGNEIERPSDGKIFKIFPEREILGKVVE